MPPIGEPDWATPGASAGKQATTVELGEVNTGVGNTAQTVDRSKLWQRLISLFLIGLCVAMVALGLLVLMKNRAAEDFAEWFIASYMIMFGTILFIYEILWWCSIGALNRAIRKNFGFLYNIRGKSLYMIFVAVLCIGIDKDLLGSDDWLRWLSGIGWLASGVGMILLTFFSPKVFENYKPSTAGFASEKNVAAESVV